MSWIPKGTVLKGEFVDLIPLQETHFEELEILARDKRIWEFYSFDMGSRDSCMRAFEKAIHEREKETQFPFVIYHKQENRFIGSTRLMSLEPAHRKLEIGWTWLHPEYWASIVNPECKLLLLTFCFEQLKTVRVMLRTDENNIRSRKAIAKIGAQFEGILRQEWIRDNGTLRSSAYFSIIDSEWQLAKEKLVTLLELKKEELAAKALTRE